MKELTPERKEFLLETIQFYSEDVTRRAVENGRCLYRTVDGRKCAIGRHIPDKVYDSCIERNPVSSETILCRLPKKIKDLGVVFLTNVQSLHDYNDYWNISKGCGLSKEGKKYIRNTFGIVVK